MRAHRRQIAGCGQAVSAAGDQLPRVRSVCRARCCRYEQDFTLLEIPETSPPSPFPYVSRTLSLPVVACGIGLMAIAISWLKPDRLLPVPAWMLPVGWS